MTLYSYLSEMFRVKAGHVEYTTYRGFYHIHFNSIQKRTHPLRHIERLRPKIDYVILPDKSILVGFSEDYKTLKKASVELSLRYLVDEGHKYIQAQKVVLESLKSIKNSKAYEELFPEDFI